MRSFTRVMMIGLLLTGCAGGSAASPASSESPPVGSALLPSGSSSPSVGPSDSPPPPTSLAADSLAEVLVEGLSLRAEPSRGAEAFGVLAFGELGFVLSGPVEADGYSWYHLASVRPPTDEGCDGEAAKPLHCYPWTGWAASGTPDGDAWLGRLDPHCPEARDTETYRALLPATRLACAGDDPWTLGAYLAPMTQGRGCYPVYITEPAWLDGPCNFLFPQPEESEFDASTEIAVHVHPTLGSCGLADGPCPFTDLKGSWVEIVGHLDDAAAGACAAVLTGTFEEAPYPPPDPDLVIFQCRQRFVATEVRAASAP